MAVRALRCSTPKRCCSSVITRPSLSKATSSVIRAWVPTSTLQTPCSAAAFTSRFCLAVREPVSSSTSIPRGARKPERVARCCRARISVGAMKATWSPAFQALQARAAATRVLPLPTSPWTSRDMHLPEAMSERASSTARRWAAVGAKGRAA